MNRHGLLVQDLGDALRQKFFDVLPLAKSVHDVHDHQWNLVRVFIGDADLLGLCSQKKCCQLSGVSNWVNS